MTEWLRAWPKRSRRAAAKDCCGSVPPSWDTICRRCSSGGAALPPRYVGALCLQSSGTGVPDIAPPGEGDLASLVLTAPMMTGAEYLTADVLRALWQEIAERWRRRYGCRRRRPAELSEGPESGVEPGRPRALQPGREPPRRRRAVRLSRHLHHAAFRPGARAARAARPGAARICRRGQSRQDCCRCCCRCSAPPRRCDWLRPMLDDRRVLPSVALDAARGRTVAWQRAADLESAGVIVRMPPAWRANRPPRPQVTGDRRRAQALGLGLEGCWTFAWRSRWTASC